jgi:ubiquinone/menaquinone biosynthesis C-methylase UbiE
MGEKFSAFLTPLACMRPEKSSKQATFIWHTLCKFEHGAASQGAGSRENPVNRLILQQGSAGAIDRSTSSSANMPTVEENLKMWDERYEWRPDGEDWSKGWGTSENQWHSFHLPRLHHFFPVQTILEIAPGFGRWTQYLRQNCDNLIAVDLSPKCINACREKFGHDQNMQFFVNDGKSLSMVPNQSVDMVFSFDSLVHAEADVLAAYLTEIKRVLRPDGIAFLHHSNMADYPEIVELIRQVPAARKVLQQSKAFETAWRGLTVNASFIEQISAELGLSCVGQELLNWGNREPAWLNDCISLITPQGSRYDRPNTVWRNDEYMRSLVYHGRMGKIYRSDTFPGNKTKSTAQVSTGSSQVVAASKNV